MQPINVEVNKARIYLGRCSTIASTFLPFFINRENVISNFIINLYV